MYLYFLYAGMEALETALGYWEDALAAYTAGVTGGVALTSQDEAEFTALLQRVIDDAYSLQDQCEHLFLHQVKLPGVLRGVWVMIRIHLDKHYK